MRINIISDLAEIAAGCISNYGFERPLVTDPHHTLIQFFSYQHRLIPKRPRKVHKPANFVCPDEYINGLNILESKIIQGEDLFAHQSRKILKLNYKDPLLNDWGIHHLHLGDEMDSNRPLIKGTSKVLFLFINNDNAYFICIAEHNTWTEQEMIRILHDNFPQSIENWRIKGVVGLTMVPTNEDVKALRKVNINSGLEIYPGIIYLGPGGGLTASGHSADVILAANRYAHFAKRVENHYKKIEDQLKERIKQKSMPIPETLNFKLVIEHDEFVIIEVNTGIEFDRFTINKI